MSRLMFVVTNVIMFGPNTAVMSSDREQQSKSQRFLVTPTSTTVMEGEEVRLGCEVDNLVGVLQWTKDDFGLGTLRELPGYERYSMKGNSSQTWDLVISRADVSDEGLYQCQILASTQSAPMRTGYASLTVLSRPQPPVLTSGPRLAAREGARVLVQCISKGGRPATQITWTRNEEPVNEIIDTNITILPDLKTMTVSTLTFEVNSAMSGDILSCKAENTALNISEKIETKVSVETTQELSIRRESEGPMYEGDEVILLCDSKPPATNYSWTVGGKMVRDAGHSRPLRLGLTRRMHQSVVTCSTGLRKAFLKLDVNYGPVFDQRYDNRTGDAGERIELKCDVDTNPPADLTWFREQEPDKVIGHGRALRLSLSQSSQGGYVCEADVSGFSKVSKLFRVNLRGPPEIEAEAEEKFVSLGDSTTVSCEARNTGGDGLSSTVTWSHQGDTIWPDNGNFSILDAIDGDILRSVLLIRTVRSHHIGQFLCRIENKFGSNAASITLTEKARVPQLVIVCSCLSVGFLIIVMVALAITFKSCSRPSSSLHEVNDGEEYLEIKKSSRMLHDTPDILHSHHNSHTHLSNLAPLDHYYHHHHHHEQHRQVVWTVPICTSSVKSDIYSNPEDYSYVRGPSYDNFQRRESQSWENQEHELRDLDLDESCPGTHV